MVKCSSIYIHSYAEMSIKQGITFCRIKNLIYRDSKICIILQNLIPKSVNRTGTCRNISFGAWPRFFSCY